MLLSAKLTDPIEPELHTEQLAFLALASIKGIGQKTLAAIAAAGRGFRDLLAIEETSEAVELLRGYGARVDGSVGADWRRVREQAVQRGLRLLDSFKRGEISVIFRNETKSLSHRWDLRGDPPPPRWPGSFNRVFCLEYSHTWH